MTVSQDSLRELFFTQSLDGFFVMMIDDPVEWTDACDKDAVLEYVFRHQRMTLANEAFARHYQLPLSQMVGMTPADFFAHDIEAGKKAWRALFDEGHLHLETDERRKDGTALRIDGYYLCVHDDQRRLDEQVAHAPLQARGSGAVMRVAVVAGVVARGGVRIR